MAATCSAAHPTESQVLVGDRAWLPFVRAHHSMRSRQSLLDSSLTQLFRTAERHRAPWPPAWLPW